MQWWSRKRVFFTLYTGLALAGVSWVGSYLLWLAQGCRAFLPFVSDFAGGLSGPLFMWGMTFAALMILPSWFDYYFAIRAEMVNSHPCWRCLHRCIPIVGVFCSASIMGVALNPWNLRLDLHILFANGIFNGGACFLFLDALIGYARGRSFKRMLLVAAFALASLILMGVYTSLAETQLKEDGIKIDFAMLGTDFHGYCTGATGSLHAYSDINIGAMFEWFLLASITVSTFVRLTIELARTGAVDIEDADSQMADLDAC